MKKSETSFLFRNEKWLNKSTSPTLIEKKYIKSRFMLPKHDLYTERVQKSKTPTKLSLKSQRSKLPRLKIQA